MSKNAAPDEGPASIADLVRRFRNRHGLSQAELAAAAGVSDGMIGNVERGTRNLGAETVDRVADALDLTDGERGELIQARKRFGKTLDTSRSPESKSWDDLKSKLSEQDRAAIQALIESLTAKRS